MRNHTRLSLGMLALVSAAACSRSAGAPAMTDDLKKDLATVGGGDVQLAGAPTKRLDVVSAGERTEAPAARPKAPEVARIASVRRGAAAPVSSPRRETPAPQPSVAAEEAAPVDAPVVQPAPVPQPEGRSQSPQIHTQREPRGGWKTPGDIIRNAPFPINP